MVNPALRRSWAALALAAACLVTACGGGGAETEPARTPQRAPAATVTPAEAARQLMDYAENVVPALFPGHEATRSLGAFVYRYYPATATYLGVVVAGGTPYTLNGVYVMGGGFGPSPTYVGQLTRYITPVDPSTVIVDSFGQIVAGGSDGVGTGDSGADGTAGDGAPISGATVVVTDVNGRSTSAVTDSVGHYRVKVTGFAPPFVARVTKPDGTKIYHSLNIQPLRTNAYVTMNITGLTDKIASDVARAAGQAGATQLTPQIVAANTSAIATAVTNLKTTIASVLTAAGVDASNFDPISTAFRPDHNGYDYVLDHTVVTIAPDGSTQLTTAGSSSSTDSGCPALTSGDYWSGSLSAGPVPAGGIALSLVHLDLAAMTGTYRDQETGTVHPFTITPETDATGAVPCAYNLVQNGTTQAIARASRGGLIAVGPPIGSSSALVNNNGDVGAALPVQSLTLTDVAGTWYAVGFEHDSMATTGTSTTAVFTTGFVRLDVTAAGGVTATECLGVSPAGATNPSLACNGAVKTGTLSVSATPGIFVLNQSNGDVIHIAAYRASNGDMAFVAGSPTGKMMAVGSKRVSAFTPRAVGDQWRVANWAVFNSPSGLASNARDITFTVTGLDSTGKRISRVDNGSPQVADTLVRDAPFAGMLWRPASSTTYEWVGVTGLGWTVHGSTVQNASSKFGISIQR